MKLKNRISIISIILATLATIPIVNAQNALLLRAEEPMAVSVSAQSDESTHATLVVRETTLTINDNPQSIYQQYWTDLMAVGGSIS